MSESENGQDTPFKGSLQREGPSVGIKDGHDEIAPPRTKTIFGHGNRQLPSSVMPLSDDVMLGRRTYPSGQKFISPNEGPKDFKGQIEQEMGATVPVAKGYGTITAKAPGSLIQKSQIRSRRNEGGYSELFGNPQIIQEVQLTNLNGRASGKRSQAVPFGGSPSSTSSMDDYMGTDDIAADGDVQESGEWDISDEINSTTEMEIDFIDESNVLLDESIRKIEKEVALHEQTLQSMVLTITRYIYADIKKKQRSFKIGIFTIILVVTFLTLLKSLIDISPIAFLKVAQDQAGTFDFQIQSSETRFVDGDAGFYDPEVHKWLPREESEDGSDNSTQTEAGLVSDEEDSIQIYGFNLLKFDYYRDKLDSLDQVGAFRGFSPRWTLPVKLRNVTNPAANMSAMIIIIDSQREAARRMGEHFSDEVLGRSEAMVSKKALEHIGVSDDKKEQVEIVFDLVGLLEAIAEGGDSGATEDEEGVEAAADATIKEAIDELMPSTEELIELMRERFPVAIDEEGNLQLELADFIRQNFDTSNVNITIPTLNLTEAYPDMVWDDAALEELDQVNITSSDPDSPLTQFTLRDLVDGDITLTLDEVLTLLDDDGEAGLIEIPIGEALDFSSAFGDDLPYSLSHNYTVIDSFELANGKFGDTLGNVALIDCHHANELILTSYLRVFDLIMERSPYLYQFFRPVDQDIKAQLEEFSLCNYAMSISGMLSDQVPVYTGGQQQMEKELGEAVNLIHSVLPPDANITVVTPLKAQIEQVGVVNVFLNTTLSTVVAFLALLSTKLIYSLMISDVEEKTYEFGMLRSLGFNKDNVMMTIIFQATSFALPGLLFGLTLSAILNVCMRHVLFTLTNNTYGYQLSAGSVWIGIAIGTIVPVLSNILPIRRALGQNLRVSLDLYHRGASETLIFFRKLDELGLNVPHLIMAIMFIVLGLVCFYVAPSAYLFQSYDLFFFIMNLLLLLMIIGLTILSILFLPFVHEQVIKMFLYFSPKDRKLKSLIFNSMRSNLRRNTNTAIMFALCLSFLLFSGCSFMLISRLVSVSLETALGADLYGVVYDEVNLPSFLDEGPISQFLQDQQDLDGSVEQWSFTSPNMKYLLRKLNPLYTELTEISDIAGYKEVETNLYSIQANFFSTVKGDYYMPTEINQEKLTGLEEEGIEIPKVPGSGNIDAARLMWADDPNELPYEAYNQFGVALAQDDFNASRSDLLENIGVIVPEGFRDFLSLDTNRSARLCIGTSAEDCKMRYRMNVEAMAAKIPGWLGFTSYGLVQWYSNVLVNERHYKALLEDYFEKNRGTEDAFETLIKSYNFTNDVPKFKMFVRLAPNITEERKDFISNGIRSYLRGETQVVLDTSFALESLNSSSVLFQVFVMIVGVIALTLAFFLLMVSTAQNIRDATQQYGCLRAIGVSVQQGTRMFMYEQYGLILSALALGTVTGLILAATLIAQFFLFMELPFELIIPYELMVFMFVMAMITTFFAVYIPVTRINEQPIAKTINSTAGA